MFAALSFAGLNAQTQVLADTSLEVTGGGGSDWTSTSTNFELYCVLPLVVVIVAAHALLQQELGTHGSAVPAVLMKLEHSARLSAHQPQELQSYVSCIIFLMLQVLLQIQQHFLLTEISCGILPA